MTDKNNQDITLQGFVNDIKTIINTARTNAVRSVDFCRVQMYWAIGQRIVEKEQQGKERADYGTYLIKNLAKEIEPEYGSGFGVRQLERCRQFYTIYPIASTLRTQLNLLLLPTPTNESITNWKLSTRVGPVASLNAKSIRCCMSVF